MGVEQSAENLRIDFHEKAAAAAVAADFRQRENGALREEAQVLSRAKRRSPTHWIAGITSV